MATMNLNLEFHQELIEEVVHKDCLVIMSKGIGTEKLLMQLIQAYTEPGLILFVLGTNIDIENYIRRQLMYNGIAENRLPKIINADVSSSERIKLYNAGGAFFISSRILVTDMLSERVPYDIISGIIVYNCHKIMSAYQDVFSLRLYRSNNKKGFIIGISQVAPNFIKGYACLDRIMRSIFAKDLFLWPRSRSEIVKSLDSRAKPEVIEMRFSMTQLMQSIQFAIMDLIGMCLRQMKESNQAILGDAEELDIENTISTSFGKFLEKRFEPVWHQLSPATKRLIGDIGTLRRLLFALTDMDCISFFHLVESVKKGVKLDTNISDWVFWKPANILFDASLARVTSADESITEQNELNLEMNLKWLSFSEIVTELRNQTKESGEETNVLVLVRDDFTVARLSDVLDLGPKNLLKELYVKTKEALKLVPGRANIQTESSNKPSTRVNDEVQPVQGTSTNVNIEPSGSNISNVGHKRIRMQDIADKSAFSLSNVLDEYEAFTDLAKSTEFHVIYHSYSEGYIKLEEKLTSYSPKYVIMFDPDLESIRRLEIYQALIMSPNSLKIYFFIYDASAEEQRYLSTLKKEKDAFAMLAREKSTMVVPEERDGKSGDHPDLVRSNELIMSSSRKSINRNNIIMQKVIVDMREFRSELPCLLHKRGIDVIPVTIEIGDYVLTNDMCVERKSISDLIGSLNSGRLYTQASVMCRHYKRSLLLIEFEESQYFNLKGKISFNFRKFSGSVAETTDSLRKLILLTITFPSLRLIWSPSPHFSSEMFEFLKVDQDQPDIESVLNISSEQLPAEHFSEKFDLELREFLLSLPGVNLHNVYRIMSSCACLVDLMKKSEDEISTIVESTRNGKALYDALHCSLVGSCVNNEIESKHIFQSRHQGKNVTKGKSNGSNVTNAKRMKK